MNLYDEDEYIMLSGIQHFAFCRRQWALIHIEQQWQENIRTIDGKIMHQKTHDALSVEKRHDLIISRGMPVHSHELGISGECDTVEFRRDRYGVKLFGRDELYQITPVEYKKGQPKKSDIDELQLTAQAICLEEMLCCEITKGYLFYGETKRRMEVCFNAKLRTRVKMLFNEMHDIYRRHYTPKVKPSKSCNACSLKDICIPALMKNRTVATFINEGLAGI